MACKSIVGVGCCLGHGDVVGNVVARVIDDNDDVMECDNFVFELCRFWWYLMRWLWLRK